MPHSYSRSADPLRLEPRASPLLGMAAVLAHGMAVASLWLADLPASLDTALGLVVLASYVHTFVRHVLLRSRGAVVHLTGAGRGPWRLVTRDGRARWADVRGDSCVHPWLVVLNFDCRPRGRATVVLLPDSLDPDELRRLRVQLTAAARPQ